jgi:hypothetical protein
VINLLRPYCIFWLTILFCKAILETVIFDVRRAKMKKLLLGTFLWTLVISVPAATMAGLNINIGIALPPPIVFQAPPDVVVLPDTNDVYVVPNVGVDIFFWNGWWWRPWEGGWYRSRYYNRGWGYYNRVPYFYYDVDPHWREYYRDHDWQGHPWNYQRIPDRELQQNWRGWHNNQYWERQKAWGVRDYHPRSMQQKQELRYQRQHEYQNRPDVIRYQQQMHEQQRYQHPQQRQPQGQRYQKPQQGQQNGQRYQKQPQGQKYQHQPQEKANGNQKREEKSHQDHQQ